MGNPDTTVMRMYAAERSQEIGASSTCCAQASPAFFSATEVEGRLLSVFAGMFLPSLETPTMSSSASTEDRFIASK
eukprot:CAMPEP_0196597578 /NCGR_PEP_ID=MMETSP1081-20130531/92078_1 /TAXON_ID=36882 /ORGANISM="Pyramimonas amylifera, Strain CCMP720" /LENGTH=75 /DNA_ID=CAMNT_0041923037 /DNA_START=114 /DNA_END=338 /DNA_ORIENTATION=+